MRRSTAIVIAVLALIMLPLTLPLTVSTAEAQPADGVIHVSASAAQGGDGSADKPYATIAEALGDAQAGATIELGDGTYREGELSVDKSVTIRAAQGAAPVLSGAEVPTSWSASGGSGGSGGTWSTSADMVRFCTVCTTNADPSAEGMAAHPEQVFVDGKPLTQVASRAEVTDSTFYVDDNDPITMKEPGNNRAGFNAKPHRGASYVIGVDPSQHTVEVSQHARALSLLSDNITLSGLTIEKYSPVQEWNYTDPEIGGNTGGVMVFASGTGLNVTGNTFRYSGGGSALGIANAHDATVSDNHLVDNGGVGMGINRSSNVTVENNLWSGNNSNGFITKDCGAYCAMSDTKVTHSENVRYAYNTVDYSQSGTDHSELSSWTNNRQAAIWFDEGVLNSSVLASHFVNVPTAVFVEVSKDNTVASNLIEGAGVGIQVAGSESTRVWNNTVTHALTSISVYEDERSNGCNARGSDGSCTLTERWSAEHGLTWDTVDTSIYNNILSSEQVPTDGDTWRYSAMVQVTGAKNADGSKALYANDMISGIDYNVYYRQPTSQLSTTVLWQYGADRKSQSINAASLTDFSSSPNVSVSSKESNGVDLQGARDANPVLVSESADPTAWKTSDLHVKPGGPAAGTGTPLPQDIADALGLSAGGAVDRGALVNAAWRDGSQNQSAPTAAQSAAPSSQPDGKADASEASQPSETSQTAAADQPTPDVLTPSGADGVAVSQDGGSLRQPAASGDKSLTLKQIAGRTAAGLGVTATIVSAAVYLFRARLF